MAIDPEIEFRWTAAVIIVLMLAIAILMVVWV